MKKIAIEYSTRTQQNFSDVVNASVERAAGMNGGYKVDEACGEKGIRLTFEFGFNTEADQFIKQMKGVATHLKFAFPNLTMHAHILN